LLDWLYLDHFSDLLQYARLLQNDHDEPFQNSQLWMHNHQPTTPPPLELKFNSLGEKTEYRAPGHSDQLTQGTHTDDARAIENHMLLG
jgi:hypothetical protein